LFGDAGAGAGLAGTGVTAAHLAETPSDTDVFASPPEPEVKSIPPVASGLDFSLDEDISLSPTSGVATGKTPAAILAGAEHEVAKSTRPVADAAKSIFDHPSAMAAGAAAAVAGVAAGAAAAVKGAGERASNTIHETVSFEPESIPKFDLDFHLDEPAAKKPDPAPKSVSHEPALAMAGAGAPAPQLARPAAAIELDKLDLAFDPARSTFEDPTPSVLDGQWHDAATKLDLAKAYQEMGDVEGAREILQEVLHEGDDQQKAEANALMAKLA
jgi:pilus assembly protein FimV